MSEIDLGVQTEVKETLQNTDFIKKEPATWQTKDTIFAVITFISSVIFVSLSVFGGFNIGFTISYFMLFALTVIYMLKAEIHLTLFSAFCGGASLLISVVFTLYRDKTLLPLFFIAVFALYGAFISLSYKKATNRSVCISVINSLLGDPFKFAAEPFRSYAKFSAETGKKGPNKQMLLGVALSIPVLIVVIPLLISSDAAFEGLMTSLFKGVGTLIGKIILGALLSVLLFSLLFTLKKGLKTEKNSYTVKTDYRNLPAVTAVTLFAILSVFYTVYLFSQLAYFFSAFKGILPDGYSLTASAYARRGFFELCAVSAINMGLLGLITGLAKRNDENKIPLSVRVTATLICGFSVIFTATAISKMIFYIGLYGLTRLRLLTGIFMVLIALIFAGIIIYLYSKKFPLEKYIITVLTAVALTIGFCDVDKTVARYNVAGYKNGSLEEIDIEHLGNLSPSAIPYLAELLDSGNYYTRTDAANELFAIAYDYFEIEILENKKVKIIEKTDFAEYNVSVANAKKVIKKNFNKILENKTVLFYGQDYSSISEQMP